MKSIVTFCVFLSLNAHGGLTSPFLSSVEGLSIPNSHQVDATGKIFRGMAPNKLLKELEEFGMTDVLIFKSQTKKEVDEEIEDLKSLGFNARKIHHIPFKWRDLDYTEGCLQTIEALKLMRKVSKSKSKKLFFHCTVGEDRTGFLAGLWRMLEQDWSFEKSYREELCLNGYGAGNPKKPYKVYTAIRETLTPLYVEMAKLIKDKKISLKMLTRRYCYKYVDLKKTDLNCENSIRAIH